MDTSEIMPAHEGRVVDGDDGQVLRFERAFPHPAAAVWTALTTADATAAWAFRATFEPHEGGRVTFDVPGAEPSEGEVLAWDEPRALVYHWDGYGGRWHVSFVLTETEGGSLLTFDHLAPDPHDPDYAAGWHWHLDRLAQHLDGETPAQVDSDAHFEELQRLYTHAEG